MSPSPPRPRTRVRLLLGYGVALAAFGASFLLHRLLASLIGERAPLLLFTLAVLAAAFQAGWGPALVAAALSIAYGAWLFAQPDGLTGADLVHLAAFSFVCGAIIFLSGRERRARRLATGHRNQADAEQQRAAHVADELNLLIEAAIDYAIFLTDPDGRIRIWNKGAERVFGWTEEEVVGRELALVYPAAMAAEGKPRADLAAAAERESLVEEVPQLRKDGSEFLADVTLTALRNEQGELRGFARVLRDVTDRRAARRAVERRERLLESVLATVPDAMIVIDESGRMISFSAAAESTFGYREGEVLGRNVSLLMPNPDREAHDQYLQRYLETGERRIIGIGRLVTGLRKDGTTFPMELSVGEAIIDEQRLFTGFVRDLTEKQRTEAQVQALQSELIHVDRLTAMGTMASTLAHELNQPLTAIANYAEAAGPIIDSDVSEDRRLLHEIFQEMAAQSIRAGGIVRRLREFISRGDVEKRVEDLPALINEAAALALIGSRERGIDTRLVLDPEATPVLVDKVQIQQVLINLMRNAVEAMEGCPVRTLRVETALEEGEIIRILVTDSGPGLSDEVADQLFHAFVTTKDSGMGLGLSISRTIIEAHGGRIRGWNREDSGAAFQIMLPRADPAG